MVAAHDNIRKPGMFSPFDGRLVAATNENIRAAEEGKLTISMPWLTDCYNEPPLQATNAGHDQ